MKDNISISSLDITRLKNLQSALLPKECQYCKDVSVATHSITKSHVGGDFYDFTHPNRDHWGFLIGDTTGHGLAAATAAAVTYGMLQHVCEEYISTAKVMQELNKTLLNMNNRVKELSYPFSATSFYGVLNIKLGYFTYSNAGHPAPILAKPNGKIQTLEPTGKPLGFAKNWTIKEITMESVTSSKLIIYTDGLLSNRYKQGFTNNEFKEYIQSVQKFEPHDIVCKIFNEAIARLDNNFDDDASLMVIDFSKLS